MLINSATLHRLKQGLFFVPDARELNLPPGSMHKGGEIYGVSMLHELHCLVCSLSKLILLDVFLILYRVLFVVCSGN